MALPRLRLVLLALNHASTLGPGADGLARCVEVLDFTAEIPAAPVRLYPRTMALSDRPAAPGLDEVAQALREARRVLFVTGAGISAESGLPTYRGVGGLYGDRHTEEGLPIEDILSGPYFAAHPEVSWRYLHEMEAHTRGARPNAAHAAIAGLESRLDSVLVLTQNVDGFHREAGSTDVLDIHGDLHDLKCTACTWRDRTGDFAHLAPLPRCPRCDAVVRPDVVLFGELLSDAKMARLQLEVERGFDVVFSVGTTSLFPYISWPVVAGARAGALTVEVNPERTPVSGLVSVRLPMRAVEAFEGLSARL